ncbi:hypothetical protein BDV95DRAFT_58003 [Massariosphaeria phaeospora]|uniref:Uncharacterized protein n=1 Tax=Massariosphaeria phaeospora TaxID=100035 RepID=A0A7C8IDB0_9PLEO|nr:hypothetical protein BDV95DRAFT_58003 [Massariosphaeria phaeospora]
MFSFTLPYIAMAYDPINLFGKPLPPELLGGAAKEVALTQEKLTAPANAVLKSFYGNAFHFFANTPDMPPSTCWIKDDPAKTIALIMHRPKGCIYRSLFKTDGFDINYSDFEKMADMWDTMSSYIAFFDYDDLVLVKPSPNGPRIIRKPPRMEIRKALLLWLGEAFKAAGVPMIKPVPGKTLEDSDMSYFASRKITRADVGDPPPPDPVRTGTMVMA